MGDLKLYTVHAPPQHAEGHEVVASARRHVDQVPERLRTGLDSGATLL